ncbi:MAG: 50S ribosomal protein L30 [Bacteroidota bacterium]
MTKIRITQVKSAINRPQQQKLTVKALKLGKINKSVDVELTPPIQGMIHRVSHLVTTEAI